MRTLFELNMNCIKPRILTVILIKVLCNSVDESRQPINVVEVI